MSLPMSSQDPERCREIQSPTSHDFRAQQSPAETPCRNHPLCQGLDGVLTRCTKNDKIERHEKISEKHNMTIYNTIYLYIYMSIYLCIYIIYIYIPIYIVINIFQYVNNDYDYDLTNGFEICQESEKTPQKEPTWRRKWRFARHLP